MNTYMTLAKLNIKNRKTKVFSIVLLMAILLFLLTLSVSNGFVTICNSYKTDDVALRQIEAFPASDKGNVIPYDHAISEKVSKVDHVAEAYQKVSVDLQHEYNVKVGEKTLTCYNWIRGTNRRFSFASMLDRKEIQKDASANPILSGRDFRAEDTHKALADENTCYILGYDNLEDILGKTVTICLPDMTIENIEIVGVFDKGYGGQDGYDVRRTEDYQEVYLSDTLMTPFFFSDDVVQECSQSKDAEADCFYEDLILTADNTDNVKYISDKISDLYHYASFNQIASIERKAERVQALSTFLYIISVIILMAAFVVVANTLVMKISNQKKYIEMLLKIGYLSKQIVLAYVAEYVMLALKTTFIAIATAFAGSFLMDMVLSMGYRDVCSIKRFAFLVQPTAMLAVILGITVFVALLAFVIARLQFHRIVKEMYES